MSEQPRSRRQTRAAILGHLLRSGGMFRPPLAKAVRLSEASLSRILFDLKAEGLIEEVRRPAPYVGGPTGLVSLDNAVALAAMAGLSFVHLFPARPWDGFHALLTANMLAAYGLAERVGVSSAR